MKRIWKPLDVMRQRLRKHMIVAADKPSHAAELVREIYKDIPIDQRPSCIGRALDVYQPAEWYERSQTISLSSCKHERECIESSRGPDGSHAVFICRFCGQIDVGWQKGGVAGHVKFGLNCDDHLLYASRYMRSTAESEDIVNRCKGLTNKSLGDKVGS